VAPTKLLVLERFDPDPGYLIVGNWSVTLTTQVLFTPTGGSEASIGTNTSTFNWGPATPVGTSSTQTVLVYDVLESYGDGAYRTVQQTTGVCGGTPYSNSSYYSSYISISRPAAPTYSSGVYSNTLAYFNGVPASYTTANGTFANTVLLAAGAANGATGGITSWYQWETGSHQPYASIPSCATCATNTITAQNASDGCGVYNVTVTTNYGGFDSESLYMFIDRPYYLTKPTGQPDTLDDYGTTGYEANIYYEAWGLCTGQGPLASYAFNEQFSTPVTNWVATNNWNYMATGDTNPLGSWVWSDDVKMEAGPYCWPSIPPTTTCSPVPQNPGSSTSEVVSVPQAWSVGTTTPGGGIVVQRDSLDRYIDHAEHGSPVSPSN